MLLLITNRDGKIIYRGIIPLGDDLLYVCQLHFVPFSFLSLVVSGYTSINSENNVLNPYNSVTKYFFFHLF